MSDIVDGHGSVDLTVRRHISAPPEAVFRLWTEADLLKKWWGPPGVTCTDAEIDLQVGGRYRIANLLPSGVTIWIHGHYEVIDRPALLRYTWALGLDSTPNERVTVSFLPTETGTEVVIFHENAPDIPTREGHRTGWEGCLDGLVNVVRTMGQA